MGIHHRITDKYYGRHNSPEPEAGADCYGTLCLSCGCCIHCKGCPCACADCGCLDVTHQHGDE